jgi:anti-anti-sigma regulatory factor
LIDDYGMLSDSLIDHGPSVVTVPEALDTAAGQLLVEELTRAKAQDRRLTVDFCGTRCCDVAELDEVLQLVAALQLHGAAVQIRSRSTVLAELAGAVGVAHAWGEACE